MSKSKEVQLNFCELTPAKYGKLHNPPLTGAAVVNRCKQGLLDAYQTEGGRWKIKIPKGDAVSRDEYDKVVRENIELKAKIEAAGKLLSIA